MKLHSATEQIRGNQSSEKMRCIGFASICVSTKHVQICALKWNKFSLKVSSHNLKENNFAADAKYD